MKVGSLVHLLLINLLLLAGCGINAPVPPLPQPSPTPSPIVPNPYPGPVPTPTPTPVPDPTPDPTPSPSTQGIGGTIFAASGGDVAGTLVGACVVVDQSFDCSTPSTVVISITQSGSSTPYTLLAPAGDYVVVAQQDVDGDGTVDYEGGYGYNPASDVFQTVASPAQGINVTLQAVGSTDPDPTPAPPSGEGISGTILAPSGWDVVGTLVSACVVRESGGSYSYDCNDPSTVGTVIMESGLSASYTLPAPADAYVVLAVQDGDFDLDADYEGGYGYDPASGDYEVVIAPAQGIDITLLPIDAGTGGVNENESPRMVKGSLTYPLRLSVTSNEPL